MVNIERYRWTPEEQYEVFDQLANTLAPKALHNAELVGADAYIAEVMAEKPGELNGLTTHYPTVDKMTGGMGAGDLIVVFGDTSHGKSQVCQNISLNLARHGKKTLFIAMEMTNRQNTKRFMKICDSLGIDYSCIPNIKYPADKDIKLGSIEPAIRTGVDQGVELVVIDQLQQLSRNVNNLANELSLICHEIKGMAMKYNIPIILISHINRQGARAGGPPTLADLKGSGSIEQDADQAIAVWRDNDPRHGAMNVVELWLRKNRNNGMEFFHTVMAASDGVLLTEAEVDMSKLSMPEDVVSVFPGAQFAS